MRPKALVLVDKRCSPCRTTEIFYNDDGVLITIIGWSMIRSPYINVYEFKGVSGMSEAMGKGKFVLPGPRTDITTKNSTEIICKNNMKR